MREKLTFAFDASISTSKFDVSVALLTSGIYGGSPGITITRILRIKLTCLNEAHFKS